MNTPLLIARSALAKKVGVSVEAIPAHDDYCSFQFNYPKWGKKDFSPMAYETAVRWDRRRRTLIFWTLLEAIEFQPWDMAGMTTFFSGLSIKMRSFLQMPDVTKNACVFCPFSFQEKDDGPVVPAFRAEIKYRDFSDEVLASLMNNLFLNSTMSLYISRNVFTALSLGCRMEPADQLRQLCLAWETLKFAGYSMGLITTDSDDEIESEGEEPEDFSGTGRIN